MQTNFSDFTKHIHDFPAFSAQNLKAASLSKKHESVVSPPKKCKQDIHWTSNPASFMSPRLWLTVCVCVSCRCCVPSWRWRRPRWRRWTLWPRSSCPPGGRTARPRWGPKWSSSTRDLTSSRNASPLDWYGGRRSRTLSANLTNGNNAHTQSAEIQLICRMLFVCCFVSRLQL